MDSEEILLLKRIAQKPGHFIPQNAAQALDTLMRLRLVTRTARGFELDEGGIDVIVHDVPQPHWVRDVIQQARMARRLS